MGGVRLFILFLGVGVILSCTQQSRQAKLDPRQLKLEEAAARNCQAGEVGVGLIGGQKLAATSRIAKGTVLVVNGSAMCTGTLISPDVVLTAAHCFESEEHEAKVYFSTDLLCDYTHGTLVKKQVAKIVRHETYLQWSEEGSAAHSLMQMAAYDFAMLKLADRNFSSEILPVEASYDGSGQLFGAGYGLTQGPSFNEDTDPMLRFAFLKEKTSFTASDENIFRHNGLSRSDQNQFIFVDQTPTGICMGDSGGAALRLSAGRLVQVGVASYVYNANDKDDVCHGTGVFVRLSAQWSWLRNTFRKLSPGVANPFSK
jgi:secreted trypsin-like serine protease